MLPEMSAGNANRGRDRERRPILVTAVVFDLGGVLIEWDPRPIFRSYLPDDAAVEEFTETVDFAAWNRQHDAGRPWAEGVEELSAQHPRYAEPIAAYPARFAESLVGPIAGTVELLTELHAQGIRLLALTNWSAESFVHARDRFDFLDLFEAIVVSGEERIAKPDPALFRLLLDRHGLAAAQTLFIDDSVQNVDAARDLGMAAVHFESPPQLRAELQSAGLLNRRIRVGIDTGGTFTDAVAVDEDTGELVTTKTPSTPADPAEGFLAAVRKALALLDAAPSDLASVSHGTTVATNALLEDRIGDLGFITTQGYEFLLEIARQSVPDGYGNSYFWVKPPRIVPVHRVRTVPGRLAYDGSEIRPFDEDAAALVARDLRDRGIDTVGVCFLHAYANPAHERRMRDILAAEHPRAVVSISSDVLREYREYERAVTTLVDTAVKPRIAAYVAGIAARLAELADGAAVPFRVMQSNGGVLSAAEVVHRPISTVLSGPAAGALGAASIAATAGHEAVLTLDGGGTSTDVCVVLKGEPSITTEGSVGRYPCRLPMVEVVTVGAGGGSVAWVSPEGTLKVGPRSAGADPGPICYGTGGTEPTVTDAHLLLGRIPPHLLGGEIPLNREAARAGLARLAGRLALDEDATAAGILEISAWNQANAIRELTVRRGLDVRDVVLTVFGGSGPLLMCRLLDLLGLRAVLVPPDPGTVSAYGLLTVDVRVDDVRTVTPGTLDPVAAAAVYADLEAAGCRALEREGFPAAMQVLTRSADLRYAGQAYEVRVPAPAGPVDAAFAARVVGAFHDEHERRYGYSYRDRPGQPVEWVNLRVTATGPIRRPPTPKPAAAQGNVERARTGTRPVRFDSWVDTPIYRRSALAPTDRIAGPAVIEEYGSTVPLHPGFTATVDLHGNLLVTAR